MRAVGLASPDLASPFERRVLPTSSFAVGRVCLGFEKRDGCGTVLCRYNPGPLCYCCARRQRKREAARIASAA